MKKAKTIEDIEIMLTGTTDKLTLDEIILMYEQLANAARLTTPVKEYIINALLAGQESAKYKVVHVRGHTEITDVKEATVRLQAYLASHPTLDASTLLEPVSIENLRRTLGNDVASDLLSGLITSNDEGANYTIAPLDDARQKVVIQTKGGNL